MDFETYSVTKAVRGGSTGLVARSDRFEVFAHRSRLGLPGERYYMTFFTACEVLSREPRQVRHLDLPSSVHSSLPRTLDYLRRLP